MVSYKKDNLTLELICKSGSWATRAIGVDRESGDKQVLLLFKWEDEETATKEYELMLRTFGVRPEESSSRLHEPEHFKWSNTRKEPGNLAAARQAG